MGLNGKSEFLYLLRALEKHSAEKVSWLSSSKILALYLVVLELKGRVKTEYADGVEG